MGRGGLPCSFLKIGKKCPNFRGKCPVVVIYVLNFSFKMQFLRVSRRKNRTLSPAGPLFLVLYMIAYQSALISRKLSCPKNFLVTRLIECMKILKVAFTMIGINERFDLKALKKR